MLKIDGVRLRPGDSMEILRRRCAQTLKIRQQELLSFQVLRRSVDARESVHLIYTVSVEVPDESQVLRRVGNSRVTPFTPPASYSFPRTLPAPECPPVIVGAGPAGLFCTLVLAQAGLRPILLERGRAVGERQRDVERFWDGGALNLSSNVQFGEGGAGAFSDGKLNTGTRDPRHRLILEQFVACGAPEEILIDAKPHVGTDKLHHVLISLREQLLDLGADIRFSQQLTDLHVEDGALTGITVSAPDGAYRLPCTELVLCPGHSARDTFEMLFRRGVPMEAKPFAVGVRIEHRQSDIDAAQYRQYAGHPGLPVSTYKLACHLPGGRAAYSFCVCPGGEVVAAASEKDRVVTNGMSAFARDGVNINGALLVNVMPEDFGDGPLSGIAFQRKLESDAFQLGGGTYAAPAQRVEDFLNHRPSEKAGRVIPTYRPGIRFTDLHRCLPDFVAGTLEEALPLLGKKLKGYDDPDAILTAVETRSSSPVRILRNDRGESPIAGLYPCGEGAGYAGGILSAAADGMRTAEKIWENIEKKQGGRSITGSCVK